MTDLLSRRRRNHPAPNVVLKVDRLMAANAANIFLEPHTSRSRLFEAHQSPDAVAGSSFDRRMRRYKRAPFA